MTHDPKLSLRKNRSEERGFFTRTAVLLMILTMLFAGGICGFAAADDLIENITDTGATTNLSADVTALNATTPTMTVATVTPAQSTVTATVSSSNVTIPGETQPPQEDNAAGIIILVIVVIVCIGAVGAGSV
ncbi:MAG TPA: hypothetical protein O0X66_01645, partial [Methanocorpusculum sp.]|nr:hypothetical protein [Methanocorpusculum sp.]